MYSLNMPVSRIRTKVREEHEKHRHVNNLQAIDVLLQQSNAEFQVGFVSGGVGPAGRTEMLMRRTNTQETLNFWKQTSQVMKYFRTDEDENAKLPKNFMSGFLEVRTEVALHSGLMKLTDDFPLLGTELISPTQPNTRQLSLYIV